MSAKQSDKKLQERARVLADTQSKAHVLVEALPFLKQFGGKRVLIKVGGELLEDEAAVASFAQDLILLKSVGIEVVLCHGGGPQITRMMKRVGKEAKFINGHRVTDKETIELGAMVLLGSLNARLVGMLNTHGAKAVGMSGVDGRMLMVEPKDESLGFVGKIVTSSAEPLAMALEAGYLPVVASIGMDDNGELYNINADLAACELAVAIGAIKFVLLTNVPGLYKTFGVSDSLIPEIDTTGLKVMMKSGDITAGMIPKIEAVIYALEHGVRQTHILDGRVEHAVLLEIFTPEGVGTMVTK